MRQALVVTSVEIALIHNSQSGLLAFANITFADCFVVKDLKIIGCDKRLIVAMPYRRLTDRCPACRRTNNLDARYCSHCGEHLAENRGKLGSTGRPILHQDVAHPLDRECRADIEQAVLNAYALEVERSKIPDYRPPIQPADTSGQLPAVDAI